MADIEPIGLTLQTDGIEKGIKKLDELAKQGPVVEKAMGGIAEQSKKVARSLSDLGSGAGDGLRKTGEAAQKAATGLQASGTAAREAVTSTESLARAMAGLTAEEEKHIRKLVEEANGLRMSRGEMEAYRAAQKGMSAGAQEIARAMGARIDAMKAEQAALSKSNDLMSQAATLARGLFAGVTFTAFGAKLVSVQREFDKLNSSLVTVTGSSANAESQMAWIKDFAKETPFGLAQATGAFVKMKALGLDPTKQALTSFGNTASAMGKDLNQMIEAVADASTGEFERLKEFGIKASKNGEEIKLTFQGVTTTVRNSAEAITKYLEDIGNNQFAGAMEQRAKTLDGAISELSDTWDELFRTVNQQNTGEFIYQSVKLATGAVDDLTTIIRAANQAMDEGAKVGAGFTAVQDAIAVVFETVVGLGLNVAYVLTQVGKEIGGLAAQAAAIAQGDFAGAAAIREAMVSDARAARLAVDQQTENVLKARQNAKEIAEYRKQIAASGLGSIASQVDGFKPTGGAEQRLNNEVESLLKSTSGLKSQAEAMAEVRKQAGELNGTLKQLREAGRGDSEQAKQLEARLQGVNEKLDSMAKKGRDRSGDSAIKKEISEYNSLVASIQGRIDAGNLELQHSGKLNDAQKAEVKLNADLSAGKLKLTAAHEADLRARLAIWNAQEKAKEQAKREIEVYKEQVAVQDEVAKAYVKMHDEMNRARLAIGELQNSTTNDTERLRLEASLIGASNVQRKIAVQLLDLRIERQKELDELGKTDFKTAEARAEAEQRINNIYDQRADNIKAAAYVEEWSSAVQQVEDIFVSGFADMMNNGKSGWESFCKSLKTSFYTMVAKEIYAMFAKPFVVKLVASLIGVVGGGGALGTAAQAAGGGGGGLLGVASNANTVYNLFTGGMAGLLGGWATSIGTMIGSAAMTQFGMGMSGMYLAPGLVGPGVSTAAGAAGASFGGALSAIPGWGWALAGIGALFGKDIWSALFGRKLKEQGVEGTFGGENGFEGNLYKYYKGGWFRSNKTTRQEMPEEMRQGFADQFFAMDKSIREMAGAVGLGGEALDGFTAKIKVNLKGLSEEEANKKLQEEFQKIAEQMGGLVLTTEEYTQAGETQLEALARLSLSITTVNGVFDALGATMLDASLSSADWASSLIELMGGLDKFSQAAATYYDLYYSDDEKRALAAKTADKGMADKGLDLRTNDADAKAKYRALVDKAIADKDEELLAWLLEFADDFSNGVDAVTQSVEAATNAVAEALQKQAEELQRARDETMSTLGLSVDGLVDGFIQEINEGRGAAAGTWLADQIIGGFEQAIYEQAITSIINSMIDGMITPMLTAALTGASISEIVSQAAIDQMIASASAAVEVLNTLLNSEDFQKGMEKLSETIASIGNTAGRAIPAMRSYQKQMASTGWDVDKDGVIYNAAEKAAEEAFQGIFDAAKTALDGAVGREKEYWQKFVDNAQESLDKAASFFDLVTDAAKGLRDSLEDVSTMQAAAGMVFLESALEQARQGKGLSDYDKTQEAVSAATGAMVMDNFASQAELDFEKKRLAGQLDELGVFADKQKTDAERLIEQGNAEIDRLDKLLEYWQNYGQASVDATLSVADAVRELEKQASSTLGQKMLGVTYDGKGSLASFDVGTNYVPSDMTARIHKGERIIPAADNRALMAALQSPSAGNAELVAELRAVKAELAEIKQHTAGTQEYSRRIDGNINQVTEGGNAMRTVAM